VFCRRDVPLTAEHVFPQWTRRFLTDPDGGLGTHTRITLRAGGEVDERSHPGQAATGTVRSVCAECNNGWMSRLESEAAPFLLSMIRGHTRTYHPHGRTLIATWFVKTALVAGSKFTPTLPPDFYTQLFVDRQPSANTLVWLAATPYDEHHQSDFRPIRTQHEDEPPPPEPNSFSAMIVVGQLVGFIVSWLEAVPATTRLQARFGPALLPMWPTNVGTGTWPPRAGRLDFDMLDALADSIVSTEDVETGQGRPNV